MDGVGMKLVVWSGWHFNKERMISRGMVSNIREA